MESVKTLLRGRLGWFGQALAILTLVGGLHGVGWGQGITTETVVTVKAKPKEVAPPVPQSAVEIKVDNKQVPLGGWQPVMGPGRGVQLVFVMDGSLRLAVGRNLQDIEAFFMQLPPSVEIGVGYMMNGQVDMLQGFTADHALAAKAIRLPFGQASMNGSPYFCLSDLAKRWPSHETGKMRAVFMVTDGVDRYNGSQSVDMDDPYVAAAIQDAQKAGISVSSMYYRDAGFAERTDAATIGGQGLLQLVSAGTDGEAYYEGDRSPISMTPYLDRYKARFANEYVATFMAPGNGLQSFKVASNQKGVKLSAATKVEPGNMLSGAGAQ